MIPVNFAGKNYRFLLRAIRALTAASAILAVTAAGVLWRNAALREELSLMERHVHEAEDANERIKPMLGERERLVKNLVSMTGLLDARRFPWTGLLTSVEAVVPIGVALQKLDYDPKGRLLTLEGVAHSPESLRNLVVGLEKSRSFNEPLLKHQSIEKGVISFSVIAVYSEYTGAVVAPGKR